MLRLIKCELCKMKRKPLVYISLLLALLIPISDAVFFLRAATDVDAVNNLISSLIQLGANLLLMPYLVIMAAKLLFDEMDYDTLKNILTVPVAMPKLLGAKLTLMGLRALFFGLYSAVASLITGLIAGLDGLTAALFIKSAAQITAAALTTYIVCMPLILLFGQMRGAYLGGSILAFFMGYSILFFKNGALASVYPFSAALVVVGFDMSEYVGKAAARSMLLALFGLGLMLLFSALLLVLSGREREMKAPRRKSGKGAGKRRSARNGALR